MKTRRLKDGCEIPLLGFGTYLVTDDEAAEAVRTAIRAGYRHIDTAEGYKNEAGVGRGIRQGLDDMGLARRDLFVTTKLWPGNPAWGQTPKTTDATVASLYRSLDRLGLEYVDLYLIHAPFERESRLAQWRGLVELERQEKTRAIGVSNFDSGHIEALRAAGLPTPVANQIELHPWSQKPELVKYLDTHDITPIAYSSLVPLATWRTTAGQASAKTDQMRDEVDQEDAPFKIMARNYGVSEALVLLRWAIQMSYPVLPKSIHPERIRANADVFSFQLDDADMAAIARMDRGASVAWATGDPMRVP